ncbi:MAG: hypothetical protein ACRD02_11850 [Acidimicrobiia bacterium]
MAVAAVLASPVGAAKKGVTKKKVRNIAKKQVNKLAPGIATGIAQTAVNTDNSSAEGIFASFKDGPGTIGDTTFATIASLPVPAGNYAFFAKVGIFHPSAGSTISSECRLEAGADTDVGAAEVQEADFTGFAQATIALEVVHSFASAGVVELKCRELVAASNDQYEFVKIIGIRGPTLTNAVSPVRILRDGDAPDGG